MSQDPVQPQCGWGQWFATQLGLFVALGIVVGFGLWVARYAPMVGVLIGCAAFAIGCIIGLTRLERWREAAGEGKQKV
jgi:hypothetical protein